MLPEHDRLTSWKEIAAFLNKGVRTVQRWEREYGLPVHRVGREGDVILAYTSEIERWVRREHQADENGEAGSETPPGAQSSGAAGQPAHEDPTPSASGRSHEVANRNGARRLLLRAAALTAIVAVCLAGLAVVRRSLAEAGPVAWSTSGNVLEARDLGGRLLWAHAFAVPKLQLAPDEALGHHQRVVVHDLEGDGVREMLVVLNDSTRREESGLYAFNADGSVRFRYTPAASVLFGGRTYTGPWLAYRVFVLPRSSRPSDVWAVFIHGYLYPTMLVRLSADGRVVEQYWSSGYIEFVARSRWRGQEVLFVAGTNNETRGGAVAIFGVDDVGGSTPGPSVAYRCESCPSGGPAEMLFFPRRCVAAAKDYTATVSEVWRDERDRLHVLVTEGASEAHLAAWYVIGPDMRVESAEFTPAAAYEHQRLEQKGMLDHAFGDRDVASLLPVRRWFGASFVELNASPDALGPAVARHALAGSATSAR